MLENMQTNDYSFIDYKVLNDNLLYLDYINNKYVFNEFTISPDMAYKYQGNFIGLMREIGNVEPSLYVYTMYINGITNPTEYDITKLVYKMPISPPIPNN